MQYDHILIRYGEMALKGKNRKVFINQLKDNIKIRLRDFFNVQVNKSRNRMFIVLNGHDPNPVIDAIKDVFGIHSFSLALKTDNDIENIKEAALKVVHETGNVSTFKVTAKRANKDFPIPSQDLNHVIGSHILQNTDNITVNVHQPDLNVRVEVRNKATYIMSGDQKGAGGLPIGTGGKVMLMLSGGIDSPVAAYLLMKRGVEIEAVHFHSPPFTSDRAKQKVMDLAQKLTVYGGSIKLHVVPFTKLQQEIHKQIPDNYSMTAMRRMMLRITEALCKKNEALALATGESLGQVASQTLESMNTINEVTNYPVLRPLVTMDKLEIIKIAKEIDTYDISIRPFEDCCTVFLPSNPKTKPRRDKINRFEQFMECEELFEETVKATEVVEISKTLKQVDHEFEDLF